MREVQECLQAVCRRHTGGIGSPGTKLDGGGTTTERAREDILKLGARLANSEGYRVVALDGRELGWLENVRYERHTDHPDELLVRRRFLFWDRYAQVPFDEVANVDPERERIYLAVRSDDIAWGGEPTERSSR